MNQTEMPGPLRVVSAAIGVLFLVFGAMVFASYGIGEWKPMLGGALVLALALDFVVGAATGEWPVLAPWMFLV